VSPGYPPRGSRRRFFCFHSGVLMQKRSLACLLWFRCWACVVMVVVWSGLAGCRAFGGDVDPGESAVPVLSGGGSWSMPQSQVALDVSNEPVATLEVQGGSANGFLNSDGTILLRV
jgi:hypothetical protein